MSMPIENNVNKTLQAWRQVEQAISQYGSYTSVVFNDATIHAVINDIGGWIALCACSRAQLNIKAIEFKNNYQAETTQTPQHHPSHLPGRIERANAVNGYTISAPVFIRTTNTV